MMESKQKSRVEENVQSTTPIKQEMEGEWFPLEFPDCPEGRELSHRLAQLSPKERGVLEKVFQGLLNKQIADRLGVTMATVEFHRARIMKKMQAKNLAELVYYVVMAGYHAGVLPLKPETG